ncbi:MAG: Ig-like domain-containing protein [Oscillospiraceae bacterium]|jgi:hypothetical protein|nr:Ig-like domain-containing protein [Oscillospiraceae bacterium]
MMLQSKDTRQRILCLVTVLALVALLCQPVAAVEAAPLPIPEVTFTNVSGDGGMDRISMTDARTFEVILPLPEGTDAEALAAGVTWSLTREAGIRDPELYPTQYLGNTLEDWRVDAPRVGLQAVFDNIVTVAAATGGLPALKLTFANITFFNSVGINGSRGRMLDYTGDFDLIARDADGAVLGQTSVRVNAYDSYRTAEEFAVELLEAKLAAEESGLYAEVYSMGQSTFGIDMPYIVLAETAEDVNNWKSFLALSIENPAAALAYYGEYEDEIRVPVLYSNIHADETNGADAPMDFVWDVIEGYDTPVPYDDIESLTEAGKTRLTEQRAKTDRDGYGGMGKRATSSLIQEWTTFKGGITPSDANDNSGVIARATLESYYNIKSKAFDSDAILDDVFFIIVPEENMDGRTHNTRQGGGGVDLNRDNLFQTQAETINMTDMISDWNPVAYIEFHGFVSNFQVEPCSPPHEPNVEYDLFAEMAVKGGEAFGAAAVVNNTRYNSYQMPLRDYLIENAVTGTLDWPEPWDDMSTNYTPQYSMLHGTVAYTVEVPASNEEGKKALEYGMMGHSTQVAENKDVYVENLVAGFKRGVENEDPDSVRPWYVDAADNPGAEANVYRPRHPENNNFFPEYYVVPLDDANQRNLSEAYHIKDFFLRNNVLLSALTEDVTVGGATYKAGSLVVNMHQAKRNVANGTLYDSVLITTWPELYSEPTTSFDKTRGFDCHEIRVPGALAGKLAPVTEPGGGKSWYDGEAGDAVVLANNSVAAVKAVNTLLDQGGTVGYITGGPYKSNFLISYEDFLAVRDTEVLQAYGVKELPAARKIEKPTIYLTGRPADNTTGYIHYSLTSAYGYNYSKQAFLDEMGFTATRDVAEADVIVANTNTQQGDERTAVTDAIASGTPAVIMAARSFTLSVGGTSLGTLLGAVSGGSTTDCLTTVQYVEESPVTDSYRAAGDNIMYGFGGNYFGTVPEGARVLIRNTTDTPFGGFIRQTNLTPYLGAVVALEYNRTVGGSKYDLTLFANTLVNKMHQKDDYRYASNAIYSKMLGGAVGEDDVPVIDEYHGSFTVTADKTSRTVTVTGAGYEPDAPVSLSVRYNAAPTDETSDYNAEVRTDKRGRLDFTVPEAVTQDKSWLGGHSYFASVDGDIQSDRIYATVVKAHSSARVSLRIKAKAKLNFSVDSETYEFASANPDIVTVDQTGMVTALRAGTTLVTLRALDGSGLIHLVTVSVG